MLIEGRLKECITKPVEWSIDELENSLFGKGRFNSRIITEECGKRIGVLIGIMEALNELEANEKKHPDRNDMAYYHLRRKAIEINAKVSPVDLSNDILELDEYEVYKKYLNEPDMTLVADIIRTCYPEDKPEILSRVWHPKAQEWISSHFSYLSDTLNWVREPLLAKFSKVAVSIMSTKTRQEVLDNIKEKDIRTDIIFIEGDKNGK